MTAVSDRYIQRSYSTYSIVLDRYIQRLIIITITIIIQ